MLFFPLCCVFVESSDRMDCEAQSGSASQFHAMRVPNSSHHAQFLKYRIIQHKTNEFTAQRNDCKRKRFPSQRSNPSHRTHRIPSEEHFMQCIMEKRNF